MPGLEIFSFDACTNLGLVVDQQRSESSAGCCTQRSRCEPGCGGLSNRSNPGPLASSVLGSQYRPHVVAQPKDCCSITIQGSTPEHGVCLDQPRVGRRDSNDCPTANSQPCQGYHSSLTRFRSSAFSCCWMGRSSQLFHDVRPSLIQANLLGLPAQPSGTLSQVLLG